jgi:UTP--glucose-1-phosphate uridylyltransferase
MSIRKAVFPVAGMGTRLLPATKSQPKEMLPVGYKPVVQYVVEEMIEQGLSKFLFITGRKKRSIEDHFDADPELEARLSDKEQVIDEFDYATAGVEFYYTRQRRPAGNADAVRLAREFVGHDSPLQPRVIERMVESHERHGSVATIGVWEVPLEDTKKYGVVRPAGEIGDDFAIADIVEKPAIEDAPSCLAVAARYIFTPEIFDAIDAIKPGLGGELWLTDAIRILLQRGAPVRCVRLNAGERRYDIGTPLTYYKAFADFALQDPEHGAAFRVYLNEKLSKER